MDKLLLNKVLINCSIEKAFDMFTKNEHLEKWFSVKADVELSIGGKYELFWDPKDLENNSTMGCKILAFDKPNYLNFEWKGAVQHKHFMNNVRPLTNVTVIFSTKGKQTNVTVIHTGWRNTEEWEKALQYFSIAWKSVLVNLKKYVNDLL